MAEMAKRGKGKGTGKEGSDGPHPFKGKGKAQPQGGKGKGPGKGPASASAVRLDPVLETAYQLYFAGRRRLAPKQLAVGLHPQSRAQRPHAGGSQRPCSWRSTSRSPKG